MKNLGRVKLGTFSCASEVIELLKSKNEIWHDSTTISMIGHLSFDVCHIEEEVELYLVNIGEDLGIREEKSYAEILRIAETFSLYECQPEIGPLVVLKFPEVVNDIPFMTMMAMAPLPGECFSKKYPYNFCVSKNRIDQNRTYPFSKISPDQEIIFSSKR